MSLDRHSLGFGGAAVRAQLADDAGHPTSASPVPDRLRIHVRFDMLGADYWDYSQAPLGHEAQGRIGWAIIGISGKINRYISYDAELNPVDDSARAAAGVRRDEFLLSERPGSERADRGVRARRPQPRRLYRFIGLDPLTQQDGRPHRRARRRTGREANRRRAGRTLRSPARLRLAGARLLDERGRAADSAPERRRQLRRAAVRARHAAATALARASRRRSSAATATGTSSTATPAFVAPDEDTNSGATGVGRVTLTPIAGLDVRVSGQYGYSGSKIEGYPSFYLSKRNDKAAIGFGAGTGRTTTCAASASTRATCPACRTRQPS